MKKRHDFPWNSPAIAREASVFIHPLSNAAMETKASSGFGDGNGLVFLYDMFGYRSLLDSIIEMNHSVKYIPV